MDEDEEEPDWEFLEAEAADMWYTWQREMEHEEKDKNT